MTTGYGGWLYFSRHPSRKECPIKVCRSVALVFFRGTVPFDGSAIQLFFEEGPRRLIWSLIIPGGCMSIFGVIRSNLRLQ